MNEITPATPNATNAVAGKVKVADSQGGTPPVVQSQKGMFANAQLLASMGM